MPVHVYRGNIIRAQTDMIACPVAVDGIRDGGTAQAVYEAGGPGYQKAARRIQLTEPGSVNSTSGYNLPCLQIVHVGVPFYSASRRSCLVDLSLCYLNVLRAATRGKAKSVSIPLIGTGRCRFPRMISFQIAMQTITYYLKSHELDVHLVLYDDKSFLLGEELLGDLDDYLKTWERKQAVQSPTRLVPHAKPYPENSEVLDGLSSSSEFSDEWSADLNPSISEPDDTVLIAAVQGQIPAKWEDEVYEEHGFMKDLQNFVSRAAPTFQQKLLALIKESGMSEVDCYKKANLSRKHYSKIRLNPFYQPRKATVIAFALALKLDIDQTLDLLEPCGFTLSSSSPYDLIIRYFIEHEMYDMFMINEALYHYNQPTL